MKLPRGYDPGWFILDDEGQPVKVHDLMTWARWLEKNQKRRIVKQTKLADDIVLVSTVFLGLNHNHWGKGPPILFETMVFGMDQESEWAETECQRYSSRDDAEVGHEMMVKKVKAQLAKAVVKKRVDDGGKG